MALRVDLLSVRLMRVSVDERERRLGDPCSRFIGVRDIDKTRSATRVTTALRSCGCESNTIRFDLTNGSLAALPEFTEHT